MTAYVLSEVTRLVEHAGPPSPHTAAAGHRTVTPRLLSAALSASCGPEPSVDWNACEVQCRSVRPHFVGAIAVNARCVWLPRFNESWRSESVPCRTFVLP